MMTLSPTFLRRLTFWADLRWAGACRHCANECVDRCRVRRLHRYGSR